MPDSMFEEKALQQLEELIGLIERYFADQDLRLKIPKERWVCFSALCKEIERIIPETMRSISHGVSPTPCEDWVYFDQLHKQLLKIVSNWRATSQMSEKRMIVDALNKANQNDKEAANLLGISRRTLRNKIKEYNLESAAFATPDLGLSGKYFTIQSDEGGQIYFRRDNSYLWSGTPSLTGRELCIDGPSTVLYHREVFEWISDQVADLIDATSVVLRDGEDRFIPDQYFEIVAKFIVGIIELPVVDLPEVFRIEGYGHCVFFRSDLLASFRVRFPATSITFRIPPLLR